MATAATTQPPGLPRRPLTRDDLDAMPDDGRRYELIDGILVVTPAPRTDHQRAAFRIASLIDRIGPRDLEVLCAPLDVELADDTVMQPDVVVAPDGDFTDAGLVGVPLLAVEVLSPSTRAYDLLLKKDRLQRAGCAHYWVVDPAVPAVMTWMLVDGVYVESGSAAGDQMLALTEPFPIEIVPRRLLGRRRETATETV